MQLVNFASQSHFRSKNINVLKNALVTTVNKFVINKLLEQLGPDIQAKRTVIEEQLWNDQQKKKITEGAEELQVWGLN